MAKISKKRQKRAAEMTPQESAQMLSDMIVGLSGRATKSGVDVSPKTALQCSAVFACVGLLAESIAQLPVKVYRGYDAGRHEERDSWVYRLLARRPCSWLTSFNWREYAMMLLCLRGDFYAYKVRDRNGQIRELLPLPPGSVMVRQLENWDLEYRVTLRKGESRVVSPKEIFHVMYRSVDGVRGLSPISCARETIGLSLAAMTHGASTFSNGAKPSGVLTLPGHLSDEAMKRLKTEWASAYSGENAGGTAVLEEGTAFQPLSMTNADAQFLETRRFQVEEIARIFAIPLFMIQSTEKTTSWGTGIEQMSMGFVRYTLLPWVKRWEEAIMRDIIEDSGEKSLEVKLNLDALQRGALNARFDAYNKGITMGVYSPNEVREREDMNPREGGNVYLTPANMTIDGGEDDNGGNNEEGVSAGDTED